MKSRSSLLFVLGLIVSGIYFGCTPKTGDATVKTPSKDDVKDEVKNQINDVASEYVTKKMPIDPSVRMGTLDNGLKYYIQKNGKPENRAELRLAINAGAIQEDDDQQGLAHFLEHMCFNGTENFEKSELVDFLESIGMKFGPDLNAYTSFDETVYMLQVRTDDQEIFDKGMLVLEDWAGRVSFEGEEIDKERGVIIGEWRSGLGAQERMRNKWFPVLFNGSRYENRLPIGKTEIIENAPYNAFTRFYEDWYRPDLMSVVVVGDVDVDAVEAQIKERFSFLTNPANPRERKSYDIPAHDDTKIAIVQDKEAASTQVQIIYKHDPMKVNNQADYRQQIVHSLYNRMMGSRFQELSQSANPPFLYGFSSYSSFVRATDAYYGAAGVKPDGVEQGLEALLVENKRVQEHGFTATELERTKKAILNRVEKSFKEADKTDSRRLAAKYVSTFLEGTPMASPKQTLDLYKKFLPTITLAEINTLAKKWIRDENRVVIVTGPEKEGITMPSEADIRKTLDGAKTITVKPYVDKVSSEPLLSTKLSPVQITETKEIEEIGVTEMTFANGVKVVLKPTKFKNDEILMSAYSEGGHSNVSDEDYMAASQATQIINQSGVAKFNNTELTKMLAGQTVSVQPYIGELSEGMNGSCSPDDFETMLQLVYLYFTNPRGDEDAMSAYMNQMKTQMQFMGNNPQFYFFDKVTKKMSNNHPRRQIMPDVAELDKVELDKVMEIYKERFADASDFTFFMTGNFEPNSIKNKLATYLGNLPTVNREDKWKDVGAKTPKGKMSETYKKGAAPQAWSLQSFGGEFDWDNAQARYDFQAMMSVVRIKLRERLREDEGGVYGVQVQGSVERWPNEEYSVAIIFNAKPEEVKQLADYVIEEIEKIKKDGVDEKDITKVKETQRQERTKKLKENRFWNGYLQSAYRNGLDAKKIQMEYYEKSVDGLTGDAVQKMANRIFDMDELKSFILLPEDKE